jgi:sugar O-acyltransferase (sialic acid O-acetyltransferase NeuD family)
MGRPLLIYGAGGSGREIAAWAARARWMGEAVELLGFIADDAPAGTRVHGLGAWPLAQAAAEFAGAGVIAAVGDSRLRERLIAAAEAAGLLSAPPLIHPGVEIDLEHVELGAGVVISPGSVVTTDIRIGRHTQINVNCTVTHDTVIGAFATLSPGTQLSGTNHIGDHAFLGTGAATVNGHPGHPLRIGDGAVVGAGAVVTRDVAPGTTVVGVPARAVANAS